jgi:hypothetical protein
VISWDMHHRIQWIQVVKYVLYVILGFATLFYYGDILKPWK